MSDTSGTADFGISLGNVASALVQGDTSGQIRALGDGETIAFRRGIEALVDKAFSGDVEDAKETNEAVVREVRSIIGSSIKERPRAFSDVGYNISEMLVLREFFKPRQSLSFDEEGRLLELLAGYLGEKRGELLEGSEFNGKNIVNAQGREIVVSVEEFNRAIVDGAVKYAQEVIEKKIEGMKPTLGQRFEEHLGDFGSLKKDVGVLAIRVGGIEGTVSDLSTRDFVSNQIQRINGELGEGIRRLEGELADTKQRITGVEGRADVVKREVGELPTLSDVTAMVREGTKNLVTTSYVDGKVSTAFSGIDSKVRGLPDKDYVDGKIKGAVNGLATRGDVDSQVGSVREELGNKIDNETAGLSRREEVDSIVGGLRRELNTKPDEERIRVLVKDGTRNLATEDLVDGRVGQITEGLEGVNKRVSTLVGQSRWRSATEFLTKIIPTALVAGAIAVVGYFGIREYFARVDKENTRDYVALTAAVGRQEGIIDEQTKELGRLRKLVDEKFDTFGIEISSLREQDSEVRENFDKRFGEYEKKLEENSRRDEETVLSFENRLDEAGASILAFKNETNQKFVPRGEAVSIIDLENFRKSVDENYLAKNKFEDFKNGVEGKYLPREEGVTKKDAEEFATKGDVDSLNGRVNRLDSVLTEIRGWFDHLSEDNKSYEMRISVIEEGIPKIREDLSKVFSGVEGADERIEIILKERLEELKKGIVDLGVFVRNVESDLKNLENSLAGVSTEAGRVSGLEGRLEHISDSLARLGSMDVRVGYRELRALGDREYRVLIGEVNNKVREEKPEIYDKYFAGGGIISKVFELVFKDRRPDTALVELEKIKQEFVGDLEVLSILDAYSEKVRIIKDSEVKILIGKYEFARTILSQQEAEWFGGSVGTRSYSGRANSFRFRIDTKMDLEFAGYNLRNVRGFDVSNLGITNPSQYRLKLIVKQAGLLMDTAVVVDMLTDVNERGELVNDRNISDLGLPTQLGIVREIRVGRGKNPGVLEVLAASLDPKTIVVGGNSREIFDKFRSEKGDIKDYLRGVFDEEMEKASLDAFGDSNWRQRVSPYFGRDR